MFLRCIPWNTVPRRFGQGASYRTRAAALWSLHSLKLQSSTTRSCQKFLEMFQRLHVYSTAISASLMSERALLAAEAVGVISQRLSTDPSLRLPASLQRDQAEPVTSQKRREYLIPLLERDPGVFLERYASKLSGQERAHFEPLRDDYEVDFYLKLAEDEAGSAESGLSATAKNRRLAQLNRLVEEGKYFSEEAMRRRAPLLYEQYIGQYAPAAAPSATAPTLPGTLLRQHDEQQHRQKLQQQQEHEAMVEEEEESPSESSDTVHSDSQEHAPSSLQADSHEMFPANKHGSGDQSQNTEDFLALMHQRFLAGDDSEYVDYAVIDKNAMLDDDWAAQAEGDAQEKYFDAE